MMLYLLFIINVAPTALDYKVRYEKLELSYYNNKYIEDGELTFTISNQTTNKSNLSFLLKEDIEGRDLEIEAVSHQIIGNIRIFNGIELIYDPCELWVVNEFVTRRLPTIVQECTIRKGRYNIGDFFVEELYFPRIVSSGSYIVQINSRYKEDELLFTIDWHIDVTLND